MSEQQNFGFGKFVPGFDFLQNLSKGTPQQPATPSLSSWVAPTLNVEELDKRIGELKAVSFWLDQNAKALAATIQALELQKMTLATLRGMNFNMGEIASALKLQPDGRSAAAAATTGADKAAPAAGSVAGAANDAVARARASKKNAPAAGANGQAGKPAGGGVVDPLQWWSALTTQFQEIAAGALRDAAQAPAAGDLAVAGKAAAKTAAKTAGAARKGAGAGAKSSRAKVGARKAGAAGR
ncbi:PhaM family polyhydroxyalkanoate granule multifunctional regulatory protein [Caenimonas terrae]|uniref:PhaM family polyhydroxyalkanoate granule multifunctional regulatory protein n=1 Tax=Caenimonas terrae TaxID=696074 RepID=A0ABW0NAZ0_9BURK